MAAHSVRRRRDPPLTNVCGHCGRSFPSYSIKQTFCGVECRFLHYQNAGALDECWEWIGPRLKLGYGVLFLDTNKPNGRRNVTSGHRYAYIRAHGSLPPDKPCVLHNCDNPACTNPAHLRAGDWVENNRERSAKGRSGSRSYSEGDRARYSLMTRGEGNNSSVLTEMQARSIKYEFGHLTHAAVAAMFGVKRATAKAIRLGRSWKHI